MKAKPGKETSSNSENHVETKEVVRPIIKTSISENRKKEGLNDNSLIRSAVKHIDPEDYDTWIKIGFALKKCFKDEGFETRIDDDRHDRGLKHVSQWTLCSWK